VAQAAGSTLYNGLARYSEALAFARQANDPPAYWSSHLNLHELVESAGRSGEAHLAAEALERLSSSTQASGTDWALGVEARSRAMLRTGDAAETLYREAIERLDRSPLRPEAARAHLLYGEWLRREKRRVEARDQLRTAHRMFDTMGARAFAERARIELSATGERARSRRLGPTADLTPQERQIAQMAAGGATNQEIASQLFLSANTIDYHLRKVFQKLSITRRGQLHEAFATGPP
jgi:DNA-binding CsgD family transcriptional regulator